MALKTIDLGTSPNKGDGDPLRTAFTKINDNFTEVYALLGAGEVDTDDVIAPMLVHNNHTNVTVTRDDDADQIIFTVDQAVTDLQGSVYGDDSTLLVDGVNNLIPSSVIQGTEANNWDTAYGWGDHSAAGYQSATAPFTGDLTGSVFGDDSTLLVDGVNGVIPKANIESSTNWDTAFSWGNHSTVGYLTSETSHADVLVDGDFATAGFMKTDGAGTYSIETDNSANWDTAFLWGDHSTAGYAPQATTYTKVEVDAAIAAVDPFSGDVTGSVFADDSTLLVDGVGGTIAGPISSINWMAASDSYLTISNGGSTGPGPIQIVASANLDLSSGTNNDINITPHGSGRVKVSDGAFGIVEAANFIGHADETMYLSSKTTSAESTHIALDSTSGVATTMYGAVDFVSGGSVDFTGSTVTGLPTNLSDFTNDLDYAPIVGGEIQANGLPSGTTFTDTLTLPVLTAEPSSPVNGMVAVADGTSWDPMSNAAQTMVVYLAGAWRQIAQGGV